MGGQNELQSILEIERIIYMATTSFEKEFVILHRETLIRLEEGIDASKPLDIDHKKGIAEMRSSEERLSNLLLSKN